MVTEENVKQSSAAREDCLISKPNEESVVVVEIPVIKEVTRRVPKREIVEVEKIVPKFTYETIEKIVEVPQIEYVDKEVIVPLMQTVERRVKKKHIVDVPVDVIRHVPKVETRVQEQIVEVPGDIIEVPQFVTVENKVMVPNFVDEKIPVLVAQTIQPIINLSDEVHEVEVYEYEPQITVVDVHVPKLTKTPLIAAGLKHETHNTVNIPPAQYNTILKQLNMHITDQIQMLPFITDETGAIPILQNLPIHPLIINTHLKEHTTINYSECKTETAHQI